jgi:hypothetical protein
VVNRGLHLSRPAILATCLAALQFVAGCGPGAPSRLNLRPDVVRPKPGVVIFLVDGLPGCRVSRGCAEGWLPNIRERFCDGGVCVEHAMTCVPAITYACIATLLTGVEPAQHQIIGNRWFDPVSARFRCYVNLSHYRCVNTDYNTPTLYELIRPASSASIEGAHVRGATRDFANWAVSGAMWLFHDYTAVDKLAATTLTDVAQWANWEGRWPTVLTCYFPGLDTVGHHHGPDSPQFRRGMEHIDHQIGRVCAWLQRQGLLESTYLVLVSDHGMVDGGRPGYIDLFRLLRDGWGRRVTHEMLQDGPDAWRHRYYDQFDTVLNNQDGRRASLHFRGAAGWREPPGSQEVEAILAAPPPQQQLWNLPGVDLVAYLESDSVAIIRSGRGLARIEARPTEQGPEYRYLPVPDDVLGYLDDLQLAAFVQAGFHSSREWLDATAARTRYPDVVAHLVPLLHVRRLGQVVLFAEPGYSFVREHGGHGGVDGEDRQMTFMLAGPGIPPGSILNTARAADLTPTLLDLLGVVSPGTNFDGVSLRSAILGTPDASKTEP